MRTTIPLAGLTVLFSQLWLGSVSPSGTNQQDIENAAVKYLRADAALRQSYPLPPDAAATLEKTLESPLDGEDKKLVAAAEDALIEFDHGVSDKRCDWAVSVEDGPLANTAHRGALMELVYVSALRARLRFHDGIVTGAVSDVLAGITASRHLSIDGSLTSVLIAHKLEGGLGGIIAGNLQKFSRPQLRDLLTGLDALPSGFDLGTAFESEKLRRNPNELSAIVEGAKNREEIIDLLLSKIPVLKSNRPLAEEIVDGCGGSTEGFRKCVNQQTSFYASWARRFSSPPETFEREYSAEFEKISRTNPVIRIFTPTLPRLRWAEAYCQTRRALLRAAIAVQLDGPTALSKYLDPYDGTPFSYIPVGRAYRLESRLRDVGVPMSLSISTDGD